MIRVGENEGRLYVSDHVADAVGGQAEVFRATDEAGEVWAVKVALPECSTALDQEIRHLRVLGAMPGVSRCIVPLEDTGWDGNRRFLVMPWRPWRLDRWAMERELDERLEALAALARTVSRLHDAGVVHRDIKGSNAFVVTRDDGSIRVQLCDFGAAEDDRTNKNPLPAYYTPEFTPPDAVDKRHRRPQLGWDIYALAVTVFKALTGQAPGNGEPWKTAHGEVHRGNTLSVGDQRLLRRAFTTWIDTTPVHSTDQGTWVEGVMGELLPALAHALDPDPSARARSVADLEAALRRTWERMVEAQSRPSQSPAPGPSPTPPAIRPPVRPSLTSGGTRTIRQPAPSPLGGWFGFAALAFAVGLAVAVITLNTSEAHPRDAMPGVFLHTLVVAWGFIGVSVVLIQVYDAVRDRYPPSS